ncbi:MAG: condensation domain-containing protein [Chthoniobacteraceae bacterium]
MLADKRARLKEWLESGEATLQPLTFPQRELWETSPVPVADMAHHICCLIDVRGLITERDCIAAMQRVVDRQEVLRVSILPGKERPLQMIRKSREVNFQFRDVPAGETRSIEELATDIFREPFDLVQGPLYRTVALRRAADDHVLVFAIHHAIADGWTLGVLIQDLFAAYVQEVMGVSQPLPAVPLSYSAWGAAERAFWQPAEIESRTGFWRDRLAGRPSLWSEPIAPGAPQRWVSEVPPALSAETRQLARHAGVTLFSTLLGAFQVAFSRWTGADDILVGTPVANRHKQAVRETMGYCSGIVPLRWRIDPARSFSEHLGAMHQMTVESFAHAMPFAELVRILGEPTGPHINPIFEVRFALQNHPVPEFSLPTLSARLKMRSTGTPRFQLGCEITEDGQAFEVVWVFRENLFSQDDIARLDRLFQQVLTDVCRSPKTRIADLIP